jgi:hypothetical protein
MIVETFLDMQRSGPKIEEGMAITFIRMTAILLDGGIKDDALWQGHWRKLVALPAN